MQKFLILSATIPLVAFSAQESQAKAVRNVDFSNNSPIVVYVANNMNHTIDFSGSEMEVHRIDLATPNEFQKSFSIEPLQNQAAVIVSGVVGGSSSQTIYAVRVDDDGVNHYQQIILKKRLTPYGITAIGAKPEPVAMVKPSEVLSYKKAYQQIAENPDISPELKSRLSDLRERLIPGASVDEITEAAGISKNTYRRLASRNFN